MNLTGYWTGTITYGPEYGEFVGKTLRFELDFIQTGKKVTGLSRDIDGFGINEDPADIKGEFDGSEIQFVKRYRTLHMADEHNTVDKSQKGPKIFYTGLYDDNLNEFTGTWIMGIKRRFFGLIPINIRTTGTWRMTKGK